MESASANSVSGKIPFNYLSEGHQFLFVQERNVFHSIGETRFRVRGAESIGIEGIHEIVVRGGGDRWFNRTVVIDIVTWRREIQADDRGIDTVSHQNSFHSEMLAAEQRWVETYISRSVEPVARSIRTSDLVDLSTGEDVADSVGNDGRTIDDLASDDER